MTQERIDLTWKCGHTASITVGYSQADLRYKMAMMASTLDICGSCQAKQAIERAWHVTQVMLEPMAVTLTGSEKQIAWARSIRTAKYEALAHVLDCLREAYRTRQDEWPAIADAIKPVVNDVSTWRAYTQAGKIIDWRNLNWTLCFRDALSRAGLYVGGLGQ
jgi:hypothetical protein